MTSPISDSPKAEAGTPCLNRHVPREEAEARIEAALKVARAGLRGVADNHGSGRYVSGSALGKEALTEIIRILEDGRS